MIRALAVTALATVALAGCGTGSSPSKTASEAWSNMSPAEQELVCDNYYTDIAGFTLGMEAEAARIGVSQAEVDATLDVIRNECAK